MHIFDKVQSTTKVNCEVKWDKMNSIEEHLSKNNE